MPSSSPQIAISGSVSDAGGVLPASSVWAIGADYAALIAAGSNAFAASGARIFNIDAGALSMASPAQIGRVIDGVTITAAMVAQNQALLNAIGTFCRANGIEVHVEAQLTNAPARDWTYQWLEPAVAAGLPITAVENNDEVEPFIAGTTISLAQRAAYETAIVAQIVRAYPNVQIGQWVTEAPLDQTLDWWNTYGAAAAAAGLPGISYVIADTPWNAPWIHSQDEWQEWQRGLAELAQGQGVALTVLVDGISADTSAAQWAAQAEQHAAMLAALDLPVATLLVRSWCGNFPSSVLPANQPGTIANTAAEIAALYSDYAAGRITGTGAVRVALATQARLAVGVPQTQTGIRLDWADALQPDGRYAVVVVAGTSLLTARAAGGATVSGSGTGRLVLEGTRADLAATIASLTVTTPFAGPDSLDIEVFGAEGRLATGQLPLFSGVEPGQTTTIVASSPAQGWTTAQVTTDAVGRITAEHLTWHDAPFDPTTGAAWITRSVVVHQPLAQEGLQIVGGSVRSAAANPLPNPLASLPMAERCMVLQAFDASLQTSTIPVLATDLVFNPTTGQLMRQTDQLAATNPTARLPVGVAPNYFASGGRQVTVFNTGDNPDWERGWNPALASVTTTYGSGGQMLERVFQGGGALSWFTLTNVYDPYTGALWEQIQSAPPPTGYADFVTGTKYVTQFNTGTNPNWDAVDWGNAAQVTVAWQDWKVVGVTADPPIPVGSRNTLAYISDGGLAFGSSVPVYLHDLPRGSTIVGSDVGSALAGAGGDEFYAGLSGTLIDTGMGGSAVHLSSTGLSLVVIASGGGDTIWGGTASATINNRGSVANTVIAQGGSVTVTGPAMVHLAGDGSSAVVGSGSMVFMEGAKGVVGVTAGASVEVSGFSLAQDDVLDLSRVLGGASLHADMANLGSVLSWRPDAAGSVLQVGAGDAAARVVLHGIDAGHVADLVAAQALRFG
ncbi:MAG: hypothetical protein J0H67_06830 [Rhodospirillales bacterium]|nr:hypothetical protein [Rhodospirillales bacterium]